MTKIVIYLKPYYFRYYRRHLFFFCPVDQKAFVLTSKKTRFQVSNFERVKKEYGCLSQLQPQQLPTSSLQIFSVCLPLSIFSNFLQNKNMGLTLMGLSNSINWESESYPEFNDIWPLPFFALLFPSVRLFLDKFVFEVCNYQLFNFSSFLLFS